MVQTVSNGHMIQFGKLGYNTRQKTNENNKLDKMTEKNDHFDIVEFEWDKWIQQDVSEEQIIWANKAGE